MEARKPASASPAERILAAADRLFYEHGIRAVGVDAVAAEAGVSKRTLYNYYATKDDPKHAAAGIAMQFKEQRRQWFRALLQRLGANGAEAVATQLQLLTEGALSSALVRGDPAIARAARAAAEVLIDAAVKPKARAP